MATGYSAESYRTTAYSCDMRWRMIFQRIGMGLPITTIAKNLNNLNIDRSTVSRIVTRFETTGDVEPIKKKGAQSKISVYDEFCIIDSIVEKPSMYLHEIQQKVLETTGTQIDASTVCRFLKNNFSRKKLSLVALQQNAASRAQFLSVSSCLISLCSQKCFCLLTKLEVTEGTVSGVTGTRLLESQLVYILCWCEARDFQQLEFCLLMVF